MEDQVGRVGLSGLSLAKISYEPRVQDQIIAQNKLSEDTVENSSPTFYVMCITSSLSSLMFCLFQVNN